MEHKNVMAAVLLILVFMIGWTLWVVPRFAPPTPAPLPADMPPAISATRVAEESSAETPASAPERMVVLRNASNVVTLDSRGGAVKSWQMSSQNQTFDLVLSPSAMPLPLASFPEINFSLRAQGSSAVMDARLPNGLRLTKTLSLNAANHLHQIEFRFINPTDRPLELQNWEWGWGPGLGTVASEAKENAPLIRALAMSRLKAHAIKEGEHPDFGRWVGIDNRYYLVAFLPASAYPSDIQVSGKAENTRLKILEHTTVPAHGETVLHYDLYVGPKGYVQLKAYDKDLEESIDFGLFGGIGKGILRILYHLKAWTGNYGVAIILLTIILQALLSPLTLKSFKAAQAMKRLQPKMARLQEMYKGDPKRLNVEMMNLYKSSGTNPFGGCLPMLLQLPIFWALFTTLRNAYELRGAPFVGWIHDLSVHDPYYILPVVMGGGMFVQQRMMGVSTDPTQRQMMFIMPIMFTIMFMNFPSGLVLYWLTNSLWTITFQWIYLRMTTGTPNRPEIVKP